MLMFDILFCCRTNVIIAISILNSLKIIINSNIIVIILNYYLTSWSLYFSFTSNITVLFYIVSSIKGEVGTSQTCLWISQCLAQCLLVQELHSNESRDKYAFNQLSSPVSPSMYQVNWIDDSHPCNTQKIKHAW